MLAMQYSFTLPADYDMTIIERRIAENGHRLDGYPGLIFKTYLYARQNDRLTLSEENLYAPFYLWQDAASLNSFLLSPGFEALSRAFGWPEVKIYPVITAALSPEINLAKFARRDITPIKAYSDLSTLSKPVDLGEAKAHLVAWDTQNWQLIRFYLWQTLPTLNGDAKAKQNYQIGHISLPKQ